MHLILTGATGMIGTGVLAAMLANPNVTRVSILSRRPVPMAAEHQKATVILHDNFETYSNETLDQLKDAKGCVWALGVSVTAVSRKEYNRITTGFPSRFIESIAPKLNPADSASPFTFVYVSGEGATTKPGATTFAFGKLKGEAELALLKLGTSISDEKDKSSDAAAIPQQQEQKQRPIQVISARPAVVDSTQHPEIQSFLPERATLVSKIQWNVLAPALAMPLRAMWKSGISPTKELGEVLTGLAAGQYGADKLNGLGAPGEQAIRGAFGSGILGNKQIRQLAGIIPFARNDKEL